MDGKYILPILEGGSAKSHDINIRFNSREEGIIRSNDLIYHIKEIVLRRNKRSTGAVVLQRCLIT